MNAESERLPAETYFRWLWVGCCGVVGAFLCGFVLLTAIKAKVSPSDISAGWFAAWGAWASGVTTTSAFLVAAGSIMVSSAHARQDRAIAAQAAEAEAMAQARLLAIYRVETPDVPSSFVFFRIENRSSQRFFDVRVPFVERIYLGERSEFRMPDPAASTVTLEGIPEGVLLTPYREHNEHEGWFTQVSVYTDSWESVKFAVHYVDAAGREWKQTVDGRIERVTSNIAVQVRKADRFQPRSQVRLATDEEKAALDRVLGRHNPPRNETK